VAKKQLTDCVDTNKKSADTDEKKVKENTENGFFPKKYGNEFKAKKKWRIQKLKEKTD
jgi:hypothetical protein